MNWSAFLLTPPPRIMRFGHISCSIACRCSSRSMAQAFHDRPRRVRAAGGGSAFRGSRRGSPSARTRCSGRASPSMNTPEPTPVPSVRKMTTPGWSLPIPNRISAIPAASASLTIETGRLEDLAESFDDGEVDPRRVDVGGGLDLRRRSSRRAARRRPGVRASAGPALTSRFTSRPIEAMTASGVDGVGVGTRRRSDTSWPVSTSTTAALIPLPPTSTPIASLGPASVTSVDPPSVQK